MDESVAPKVLKTLSGARIGKRDVNVEYAEKKNRKSKAKASGKKKKKKKSKY